MIYYEIDVEIEQETEVGKSSLLITYGGTLLLIKVLMETFVEQDPMSFHFYKTGSRS